MNLFKTLKFYYQTKLKNFILFLFILFLIGVLSFALAIKPKRKNVKFFVGLAAGIPSALPTESKASQEGSDLVAASDQTAQDVWTKIRDEYLDKIELYDIGEIATVNIIKIRDDAYPKIFHSDGALAHQRSYEELSNEIKAELEKLAALSNWEQELNALIKIAKEKSLWNKIRISYLDDL